MAKNNPIPTAINFHKKSRELEISFDEGSTFSFSSEFLRVFSPSAEVRGHGPGQETLQLDKQNVNIENIEPVGNYAIKLVFSDKHDSGLYSWDLLYDYGCNKDELWQKYQQQVEQAGHNQTG